MRGSQRDHPVRQAVDGLEPWQLSSAIPLGRHSLLIVIVAGFYKKGATWKAGTFADGVAVSVIKGLKYPLSGEPVIELKERMKRRARLYALWPWVLPELSENRLLFLIERFSGLDKNNGGRRERKSSACGRFFQQARIFRGTRGSSSPIGSG
jgi:hypothetical protein